MVSLAPRGGVVSWGCLWVALGWVPGGSRSPSGWCSRSSSDWSKKVGDKVGGHAAGGDGDGESMVSNSAEFGRLEISNLAAFSSFLRIRASLSNSYELVWVLVSHCPRGP